MSAKNRYPNQDRYINLLTDFEHLFEVSEIANFSAQEQDAYENSLKYYRDLQNVVTTSRQEGIEQGRQEERLQSVKRQRSLLLKQLSRKLGNIPEPLQVKIAQLSLTSLEALGEMLFDLESEEDLRKWLNRL
ncbi:MAG: DUF4351 domain-containing protein [Symploca sp. SIO2D2]|nr:DUF4351 domain-containing protein [Symploca sp. SIO2D2]